MSRFGTTVRTYGRSAAAAAAAAPKDDASKAFDAAVMFGTKPSPAMATSTAHRFGTYSFTSTRVKDAEVEPRKRKVEEPPDPFDDPFSFDSDGDDGPTTKKKAPQKASSSSGGAPKATQGGRGRKPAATQAVPSNGRTLTTMIISRKKKVNDGDADEFVVKKGPAKTYNKASVNSTKSKAEETKKKPTLTTKTSNTKQLSMDSFTRKLATLSPPQKSLTKDSDFSRGDKKKKAQKPAAKKFFTSSQDSEGMSDHNYSVSPRNSHVGSDDESRGSDNNFLLDSDMELESGDPEIVFNSPKKKANQAEHSDTDSTEDRVVTPNSIDSAVDDDKRAIGLKTSHASQDKDRESPAVSVDSDDDDGELVAKLQPKATKRTYNIVMRKSSSDLDIPPFNAAGLKRYGKSKLGSKKPQEAEKKFANLAGKKLEDEDTKAAKKSLPYVRRLLTSPKKVRSVLRASTLPLSYAYDRHTQVVPPPPLIPLFLPVACWGLV